MEVSGATEYDKRAVSNNCFGGTLLTLGQEDGEISTIVLHFCQGPALGCSVRLKPVSMKTQEQMKGGKMSEHEKKQKQLDVILANPTFSVQVLQGHLLLLLVCKQSGSWLLRILRPNIMCRFSLHSGSRQYVGLPSSYQIPTSVILPAAVLVNVSWWKCLLSRWEKCHLLILA